MNTTSETDIINEWEKFTNDKEEVRQNYLSQIETLNNLTDQQSITRNSSDENFINLAEQHYLEEYSEITEKLQTSEIKLAASQASLWEAGSESIDREVIRNTHEFHSRLSNGVVLSDDELRQRFINGLANDPELKD